MTETAQGAAGLRRVAMAAGMGVQDWFVALNGLKFDYREWDNDAAPPLVLLHGVTSRGRAGDAFAETVADRYWILAIDQRGRSTVGIAVAAHQFYPPHARC